MNEDWSILNLIINFDLYCILFHFPVLLLKPIDLLAYLSIFGMLSPLSFKSANKMICFYNLNVIEEGRDQGVHLFSDQRICRTHGL